MTDRILVPLPDGRWLALSPETFAEGLAAGEEAMPRHQAAAIAPEALLSADQLSERTGVPASWWESAARRGEVPHRQVGKYKRFLFSEIEEATRPKPTDLDSALAFRRRVKTGG